MFIKEEVEKNINKALITPYIILGGVSVIQITEVKIVFNISEINKLYNLFPKTI